MKYQRTGLTEGSLLYNEWLKAKGLYRPDTEAEFINWLYSTSGWYDKTINGSYFDFDAEKVKASPVYQRFLDEYKQSLRNSDIFHLMVHSSYHLRGLEFQLDFANQFSQRNYCYWQDKEFLTKTIQDKRVLVVGSVAPLIAQKYEVTGYRTPQNFMNRGDEENSFETLDKVMGELPMDFDIALVSFGAYGCLLVDRICKTGRSAMTIGSGIYELYPVSIPDEYKPKDYLKIENGRYWR